MTHRTSFQLGVERLECRRLLAGNVTVTLGQGNLLVIGDDLPNCISVESAGAGNVQVRGFQTGSAATKINGANAPQVFSGVTGDITIRLRGGDDLLRLTNCIVPGNVVIAAGTGHDQVVTGRDQLGSHRFGATPSGPLYLSGNLNIAGDTGDDVLFQSDLHVAGAGALNLGAANDTLHMQRPASGANVDYGALTILPNSGDDVVDIFGLIVEGNLTINDSAGALYLVIRSMDVHHDFQLATSSQADDLDVSASHVTNAFRITSGDGNDRIRLSCIADRLQARLGDGNDALELVSANIRSSAFYGESGNDTFFARYATGIDALFDGGDGTDTFRDSDSLHNHITHLAKHSIERNKTLI